MVLAGAGWEHAGDKRRAGREGGGRGRPTQSAHRGQGGRTQPGALLCRQAGHAAAPPPPFAVVGSQRSIPAAPESSGGGALRGAQRSGGEGRLLLRCFAKLVMPMHPGFPAVGRAPASRTFLPPPALTGYLPTGAAPSPAPGFLPREAAAHWTDRRVTGQALCRGDSSSGC